MLEAVLQKQVGCLHAIPRPRTPVPAIIIAVSWVTQLTDQSLHRPNQAAEIMPTGPSQGITDPGKPRRPEGLEPAFARNEPT